MARGRRARFAERDEPVEPNLTPLIDVVFVVLIMFIVVAPILELDRVHLATGQEESSQRTNVRETGSVVIHVHENNSIWLNQREIDPSRLEEGLVAMRATNSDRYVQLLHDRSAHFGTYQMVKNAVEAAGFEELDVILQPR